MPSSKRSSPGSPHLRLAADIGGTFTDIAAFDEATGRTRFRQGAVDAGASGRRHLRRGRQGRQRLRRRGAVPARLDHRHQHDAGAHRRQDRTAHHRRLSRHLRNRPHQPAGRLQSVFPKHVPLIERALRFEVHERMLADGEIDIAARRGRDRSARRASLRATASKPSPSCSSIAIAMPSTRRRAKAMIEKRTTRTMFVSASHELSQEYREFERCSTVAANAYIGPKVRALYRRDRRRIRDSRLRRLVPASCNRPAASTKPSRRRRNASACWNPGRPPASSARRRCATRSSIDNAIAFDMGGTTAKAGVIYKGEALTTGAALIGGYEQRVADADRDDGYLRSRHRRRLDRARRRRRAARRPAERRRRSRVRPATGSAAPSRPSPTPIWCSAGSAPIAFSAARCSSTSRRPSARSRAGRASRSG